MEGRPARPGGHVREERPRVPLPAPPSPLERTAPVERTRQFSSVRHERVVLRPKEDLVQPRHVRREGDARVVECTFGRKLDRSQTLLFRRLVQESQLCLRKARLTYKENERLGDERLRMCWVGKVVLQSAERERIQRL